jgi:predicted Zn-dependent peptidase
MKNLLTIMLALLTIGLTAQVDRTKLPEPAAEKEIKIGDYDQFKLKNGLTVIVVENNKLPRLTWNLSFDVGIITEGDKAGYAGIFGQVMSAGTTSRTKEVLNEEIDFMGANISAGASSMFASSLSKYKTEVLDIMTDMLYNPSFPQDEFDRAIEQTLTGLKQSKDDPSTIAGNVRGVVNYGKTTAFGELTTEETVGNITLDDLKNHYDKFFKPNIAYLVVVGDITKKEAQKLTKEYFGKWKSGEVQKEGFDAPASIEKTAIAFVDRPSSVQSVINITYPVDNKPGNDDITKVSLMNNILGGGGSARLFMNLREDKGYTYGAYSSLGSSRYSATFNASASVRNEVTDSSLVQFMYEMERIKNEPVSQDELDLAKSSLKGSFARSLESAGTIASFARNTLINDLPKDYYANYLKRIEAVTIEDIQEVAQKYIRPENANIVIVGKAEDVAPTLKPFGDITYYDAEGNIVDDPTKVVMGDVDVADILAAYVEAIGGREKLDAVKTLQYTSKATLSMGPQSIELTRKVYQKEPDKFLDETIAGMMGSTKQIYNAGSGKIIAGGREIPAEGPMATPLKYLGVMFGERFYADLGYELSYKGISKVDGNDAHRVDVTIDGTTFMEYYDVASGLKVRADLGQSGVYTFADYTDVDGVMIPFKLTVKSPQLPSALEFVVSEAKINEDIDDAMFE